MRTVKALWLVIAIISGIYILLSELELLPTDFAPADDETVYILELLSVILSIGGIWLALRLLSFGSVKSRIGRGKGQRPLPFWYSIRLAIIGIPMWVVSVIYYSTSATDTPAYCLIIIFIAYIFCYPKAIQGEK